jgi:hypothetical protein
MNSPVLRSSRFTRIAIILAACCAFAQGAAAQTMSFSTYSDAAANSSGVINMWTTVVDSSSGCSHGNYLTTARVVSPSNRTSSSSSSGLSSSTNLSIDDEWGDYSLVTTGTYQCSCMFNSTISFGAPAVTAAASETTIEVNYTYVSHSDDLQMQVRRCDYRRCEGSNTSCWNNFQDINAIGVICPAGITEAILVKKFLGIPYRCEPISHTHLGTPPCL